MKTILTLAVLCYGVLAMNMNVASAEEPAATKEQAAESSPLNQEMKTLEGKKVNLAKKYDDKVVLLVNVASKCGLTPQYEQLQALHEKYAEKGLAIIGVPCNQFGQQEPGTPEEIAQFCEANYGVEFDLMAKVDVNGPDAAPLYKYLTSKETNPADGFQGVRTLISAGEACTPELVARFSPADKPDSPEVIGAIEKELAKK